MKGEEKMHVPKYIENALQQRAKHAERFNHYDYIISEWIDKYNIMAEECDYHGGVESIVNPYSSSARILEAIKKTKRN